MSSIEKEKILKKLSEGDYHGAEEEIYRIKRNEAAKELEGLLNEFSNSQEGHELARELANEHGYGLIRRKPITISTVTGDKLKVTSWYGLKAGKKMGRFKKGRNGRGAHLLLRYWGFLEKRSSANAGKIARLGVACQSFELAKKELYEQGHKISSVTVNNVTQKVGELAQNHRAHICLENGESFAGKRVMIAVDGGRIRTKQKKAGRFKKGQKQACFDTNWKEPKLVVIAEIDANGNMKKDKKPIYEATMGNHEALFGLLEDLVINSRIHEAEELVFSADGADWIWIKFGEFAKKFDLSQKSTEVLDFFHATEHLMEICEENTSLDKKTQRVWFGKLKELLKAGDFKTLQKEVVREARTKKLPKIKKLFGYFEKNKNRMKYHSYKEKNIPIGSGIVESAIRRVINLKLKSPSTFWTIERLEIVLHLRCILMADRWGLFMHNIRSLSRFC